MKRCLNHTRCAVLLLALTVGASLAASSAWAESKLYELSAESSYLEGCYEPCRCLLMQNPTLRGKFLLGDRAQSDTESVFDVRDIAWFYMQDGESILVSGTGTYQVAADRQRLLLDLIVGDTPVQRFDSGWVPRRSAAPGLTIAVALNEFFCYDYVFDLDARPAAVSFLPSTWGHVKAVYR